MYVREMANLILIILFCLLGCGDQGALVTGKVTCSDKPVTGSILFSPKGANESTKGPAVNAALKEDGSFEIRLKTIGTHLVQVTPRDVKFPVRPGEIDYPCDRSPIEREVTPGGNDITIELVPRR